jgi:hypothetical protein
MTRLHQVLDSVVHSDSPAQFLLFGLFSFVLSGLFPMDSWLTLSASLWKFAGVGCILATIWASQVVRRAAMLVTTMLIIVTGAFYFSTFSVFDDSNDLRAAMQSRIMIVFLMTAWGLFLANLITRQILETDRLAGK